MPVRRIGGIGAVTEPKMRSAESATAANAAVFGGCIAPSSAIGASSTILPRVDDRPVAPHAKKTLSQRGASQRTWKLSPLRKKLEELFAERWPSSRKKKRAADHEKFVK